MPRNTMDVQDLKKNAASVDPGDVKYALAVYSSSDAMIFYDAASLEITDVNPAAVLLYGYSHEEFLQLKCTELSTAPEVTVEAIKRKEAFIPVFLHRKKDGTIFSVSISRSMFSVNSQEYVVATVRDISGSLQIQKELELSRQLASDATSDYVWDWDMVSGNVNRPSQWIVLLGYEPGEIGTSLGDWAELLHPDDRASLWNQRIKNLANKSAVFDLEYRIRRKDGTYLWCRSQGRVVSDSHGRPIRMIGFYRDISMQKNTEEQLRFEHSLLETQQAIVLEMLQKANKKALLAFILERTAALVGAQRGYIAIPDEFYPDSMVVSAAIGTSSIPVKNFVKGQYLGGRVWQSGEKLLIEDYKKYRAEALPMPGLYDIEVALVVPIKNAESVIGILTLGFPADTKPPGRREIEAAEQVALVTALALNNLELVDSLHLSQRRWQIAGEAAGEGIWDWDLINDKIFRSPRWSKTLGYEEGEIEDRHYAWRELIHPEDRELAWKPQQEHLEGKTGRFDVEYRLRCKDGSYRWFRSQGQAVRDEQGRPTRIIGFYSDVHVRKTSVELLIKELEERRRSDEKLREQSEKTEQAYIAVQQAKAELSRLDERGRRKELFDRLISGELTSRSDVLRRAQLLGIDLATSYGLQVINIHDWNGRSVDLLMESLREYQRIMRTIYQACESIQHSIVWERQDRLICLYPVYATNSTFDNKQFGIELASELQTAIFSNEPGLRLSIGIGSFHPDIMEIHLSYSEAQSALFVGEKLWPDQNIYHYMDIGICQLWPQLNNSRLLQDFIEQAVGKIIVHDKKRKTALLRSLEELVKGGSIRVVAERLFIHQKTLQFRKRRIEAILGVSLDDSDTRLILGTALNFLKLQGYEAKEGRK